MASATMPTGRLTRKMPRQLIPVVMTPPRTGPSDVATPVTAPQMPKATPRSLPMERLGQQRQRRREEDGAADALEAPGERSA